MPKLSAYTVHPFQMAKAERPWHSAGSQAVIVETEEGRTAVSGFCCLATNSAKGNLAVPGIHENFEESYNSMLKLMRLAEIIYANHSAEAVRL